MRALLVSGAIVLNIGLVCQYITMRAGVSDFGNISSAALQKYLLVTAAVANICILTYVARVCFLADVTQKTLLSVTGAVFVYYILQFLFLPLTRASLRGSWSKAWVRLLLCACVVPLSFLAYVTAHMGHVELVVLSVVPLCHACVNDALVYGVLF